MLRFVKQNGLKIAAISTIGAGAIGICKYWNNITANITDVNGKIWVDTRTHPPLRLMYREEYEYQSMIEMEKDLKQRFGKDALINAKPYNFILDASNDIKFLDKNKMPSLGVFCDKREISEKLEKEDKMKIKLIPGSKVMFVTYNGDKLDKLDKLKFDSLLKKYNQYYMESLKKMKIQVSSIWVINDGGKYVAFIPEPNHLHHYSPPYMTVKLSNKSGKPDESGKSKPKKAQNSDNIPNTVSKSTPKKDEQINEKDKK